MYKIKITSLILIKVTLLILSASLIACEKSLIAGKDVTLRYSITEDEVNVLDFRDSTDTDQKMIQMALNYAKANHIRCVFIPDGEYEIEASSVLGQPGILIPDSIHLKMSALAVLKAIPNSVGSYTIVRVHNASQVKISGGTVKGERGLHVGTVGEWGMGIDVRNSDHVEINNVKIRDCWGDGIYIGGALNDSILIDSVYTDNNRRQGLSAVNCDGLIIRNSRFTNTNGKSPQSGVDLEPNLGQKVTNVKIYNCKFEDNKSRGLLMWAIYGEVSDVEVSNCTIDTSIAQGIYMGYNVKRVKFNDIKISNVTNVGLHLLNGVDDVEFTNVEMNNAGKKGVVFFKSSNIKTTGFEINEYEQGITIDSSNYVEVKSTKLSSSKAIATGIDMINSAHIEIDTVSIDLGKVGIKGLKVQNLSLLNSKVKRASQYGLHLDEISTAVLKYNQVDSIGQVAFWLTKSAYLDFSNNSLIGNSYVTDNVDVVIKVDGNSNNNLIKNNLIQKGIPSNKPKYGISLGSLTFDNEVSTNTIDTNSYHVSPLFNQGTNNTIIP